MNLPTLLTLAVDSQIYDLPLLRSHQMQAWHCLLAQLAATALGATEIYDLPTTPPGWRQALLNITQGLDSWDLVGERPDQPAFLQPPVTDEAGLRKIKDKGRSEYRTPDGLDLIYSSKAHDVKPDIDLEGDPASWLYALVDLQTAQFYSGNALYGVSRMRTGQSSRPFISLTPSLDFGTHLTRDIRALLEHPDLTGPSGRPTAVWELPWTGKKEETLDPEELAPLYVDTCRRVRLIYQKGKILAVYATSESPRVTPGLDTGDPWAPMDPKRGKPMDLQEGGFTWRQMCNYISGKRWQWSTLMHPSQEELASPKTSYIIARSFSRSQGKMHNHYQYIIPLSKETMEKIARPEGKEEFQEEIKQWLAGTQQIINQMRRSMTSQGYTNQKNERQKFVAAALDPWIEERFWTRMQGGDLPGWQRELAEEIRKTLRTVLPGFSTNAAHCEQNTLQTLKDMNQRLSRTIKD